MQVKSHSRKLLVAVTESMLLLDEVETLRSAVASVLLLALSQIVEVQKLGDKVPACLQCSQQRIVECTTRNLLLTVSLHGNKPQSHALLTCASDPLSSH